MNPKLLKAMRVYLCAALIAYAVMYIISVFIADTNFNSESTANLAAGVFGFFRYGGIFLMWSVILDTGILLGLYSYIYSRVTTPRPKAIAISVFVALVGLLGTIEIIDQLQFGLIWALSYFHGVTVKRF